MKHAEILRDQFFVVQDIGDRPAEHAASGVKDHRLTAQHPGQALITELQLSVFSRYLADVDVPVALPNSSNLTTPRTVSALLPRIAVISAFLSLTFLLVVLERYKLDTVCYFYGLVIYPTDAVNDQVITTLSIWRIAYFRGGACGVGRTPRVALLMQCGIAGGRVSPDHVGLIWEF